MAAAKKFDQSSSRQTSSVWWQNFRTFGSA